MTNVESAGPGSEDELSPDPGLAFERLRGDAAALLEAWTAPTARLEAVRARLHDVALNEPGCMSRDAAPVHFTAGLILLNTDVTQVALTLHGKAKRWFQFGGHLESVDTSVLAAAAREGREESGITEFQVAPEPVHLDAHQLSSAFGRCQEHLDVRFAARALSETLAISDESDDVRWWPLDALPHDTEASLREAISLAVARVS